MPLGGGSQWRSLAPLSLLSWVSIKEGDDRISHMLHFWKELLIPHPISSTRAPTLPSTGSWDRTHRAAKSEVVGSKQVG